MDVAAEAAKFKQASDRAQRAVARKNYRAVWHAIAEMKGIAVSVAEAGLRVEFSAALDAIGYGREGAAQ